MNHILHITTRRDDAFAKSVIEQEQSQPETRCEVIDLTKRDANYDELVQKIFAADSVQVW